MAENPPGSVVISDEEVSAYLNGALGPLRRARVDAVVRADRRLARKVQAYRAQEHGL